MSDNGVVEAERFTPGELRILWHLKDAGGTVSDPEDVCLRMEPELHLTAPTIRHYLLELERKSVVLRHMQHPERVRAGKSTSRTNKIIKVELVDPEMELPFHPHYAGLRARDYINRRVNQPSPVRVRPESLLGQALEIEPVENNSSQANNEPDFEEIFVAMVARVNEQHEEIVARDRSIEKLQDVIEKLTEELNRLNRRQPRKITDRMHYALGEMNPEEWAKIQRQAPGSGKE